MTATGREERAPRLGIGVDQVARENHRIEAATEVQLLDAGAHRLGSFDAGEHLRGLVHRRDVKAESDELPRDPTRATPELEHRAAVPHRVCDELTFAHLREQGVEPTGLPSRAAVKSVRRLRL